jgi:hypothetical protein
MTPSRSGVQSKSWSGVGAEGVGSRVIGGVTGGVSGVVTTGTVGFIGVG